jgi:hypothetical protein
VKQGVGCETCHGRVDRMPLMIQKSSLQMEWCLDCHRNPERYLRPRDQVTMMGYQVGEGTTQAEVGAELVKAYNVSSVEHLTSCSVCHR